MPHYYLQMTLTLSHFLLTKTLACTFSAGPKGILLGFALYLETFICVEKLGEKYKNLAVMRDPHYPLVSLLISKRNSPLVLIGSVPNYNNGK